MSVNVVLGRFEALVAPGVAGALRRAPGFQIVASDLDARSLSVSHVRECADVAVLPDSATSRAIQRLKDVGVAAGFVVVAHNPSYARGFGLLAAGASCAASNASAADLVEVVRLAARGTNLFVASNGERWGRARPSEAELSRLTKREWEVLSLLVAGASYPVVAEELGLGLRTVQTHAQRVLEKLEIRDKRQLVGVRLDDLRRVSANAQRPVWQAV